MTDPEQSSNTSYNVREAKNALDSNERSIIHTDNKRSGWWTAKLQGGTYAVESVSMKNRPDGWGHRLGDTTIEVDGKLCGKVTSKTVQGAWYTVKCAKPILGRSIKVTSKAKTPLHFAEIRAHGKPNKQCSADKCSAKQFLLKTGKCGACPTDYVQDPKDKKNCVYGKYVKEIKCKRGHRVDQLQVENFAGSKKLSHNGFAGGGWRNNDQIVKLPTDEYVKRVDGYHITSGYARNQLAKVVYFTSKDRIISCYYNRVRYRTERKTFTVKKGEYIQHINQYEDKRKCCGRITSVDTDTFKKDLAGALDDAALKKCSDSQYLKVEGENRSCVACKANYKRDADDASKCVLSCGDYTYLNADGNKCVADTCTRFEKLGKDGKCAECEKYVATPEAPAAPKLTKVALKNAKMSSQWCCKFKGMMLEAKNAIDGNANTMAHTRMGRGHWWYAQFTDGNKEVSEVRILNRKDCCGGRLKKTKVYVGRYFCGDLPDSTANGKEYIVKCAKPVTGNTVIIRQNTTYTALQLANVEVYGNDNCDHDERKNKWGAHKCMASSDCAGARYCSRWRWCHGKTGCPAVAKPKPQEPYVAEKILSKRQCGKMEEQLDKEGTMKTVDECLEAAAGDGYDFFVFSTHKSGGCRGCVKGTEKSFNGASNFDVYEIKPNYPVYLQDAANKKQCKLECDPRMPWDATLKKCRSSANVQKIKCSMSADQFVDKVEFKDVDGKSTASWTNADHFEIKLETPTASSTQVVNTYKPEYMLDGDANTLVHTKTGVN
jgi:hypothetical protein